MVLKKKFIDVKKELEKHKIVLLWNEEEFNKNYKNNKTKLPIICICKNKDFKSYNKLSKGQKCQECKINKMKETNIKKYGVENPLLSEEIKEKIKQTNIKKYGVENPLQNEEIKEKIKQTNMNKYGVEFPLQSKEIIIKMKETNMNKYGAENIMQVSEIFDKQQKTSYKLKDYIFPSGKIIKIQGYEHFALNDLIKNYKEDDIITVKNEVPEIWYIENNIKRRYYTDIYIKSENKCIEVKSEYTVNCDTVKIKLKEDACKNNGYSYELKVYKRNGTLLK